ncbi:MAG: hypothetical protein M1839_002764 [Geoglossum umbratile]|nr:MAG: hypothetical protein M1839_002764 [Geoglossum umbratile]
MEWARQKSGGFSLFFPENENPSGPQRILSHPNTSLFSGSQPTRSSYVHVPRTWKATRTSSPFDNQYVSKALSRFFDARDACAELFLAFAYNTIFDSKYHEDFDDKTIQTQARNNVADLLFDSPLLEAASERPDKNNKRHRKNMNVLIGRIRSAIRCNKRMLPGWALAPGSSKSKDCPDQTSAAEPEEGIKLKPLTPGPPSMGPADGGVEDIYRQAQMTPLDGYTFSAREEEQKRQEQQEQLDEQEQEAPERELSDFDARVATFYHNFRREFPLQIFPMLRGITAVS